MIEQRTVIGISTIMITTTAELKKPLLVEVKLSTKSIFQSAYWEKFKLATGYTKSYTVSDILVLQKRLPLGFSMLYAPMVSESQMGSLDLSNFAEQLRQFTTEQKAIFFRLELDIDKAKEKFTNELLKFGFTKSFEDMQPVNNWLIDLRQDEQEILSLMKQKCRYNIRQGEKGKLEVTHTSGKGRELNAFYKQYSETGKRHKISYRDKSYFDHLIDILGQEEYARVYIAWKDKTPLASAIVIYDNKEALYLYGGSAEEKRELMAPYFLQWQIIKDAKALGMKKYNFLGVSPDDDPNHPWAGLTSFKKRFGGYQHDILGCYDLPLKPSQYKLFKLIEKIRRHP